MRGFPGRVFYGSFNFSFFPLLSLSVTVKVQHRHFQAVLYPRFIHKKQINQWVKPSGLFVANRKCFKLNEVVYKCQWKLLQSQFFPIFKKGLEIVAFSLPYCFSWRDVKEKWLKGQLVSLESLLLVCSSHSHDFKRCFAGLAHSFSHFNHQMWDHYVIKTGIKGLTATIEISVWDPIHFHSLAC